MSGCRPERICALLLLLSLMACAGPPVVPSSAAECPAWADYPVDRHSNRETSHLGCSTRVNLRSAVEDPDDLQYGSQLGPSPASRGADAVKAYETGKARPITGRSSTSPVLGGATTDPIR